MDFSIQKSRYPGRKGGIIRGREDKVILRSQRPQRQEAEQGKQRSTMYGNPLYNNAVYTFECFVILSA